MLNQMRSGAGNFAAKLLLVLLILSFALWGIEDMVVRSTHNLDVAVVGKTSISASSFASALQQERERVQRSLGANYTPELLESLPLAQNVLQRLINRALLKQESADLGLYPSDNDIAERIHSMPQFNDEKGQFNKAAFMDTLRRNNLSEKSYVEQLRQDMAMGMLLQSLSSLPPVPEIAVRTLQAALNEQRTATLYTLPASAVTVGEPDDAAIETYYNANSALFSIPEYRTLRWVTITESDVAKSIHVSDDDLRKAYTERAADFKRPERRRVEQLLYGIEADAKKAAAMLASGKSLEATAQETGALNKKALSLGDVEKDAIIAEAADAVFALKSGEYTAPIKSAFGWHIFHVSGITAPSVAPFEEIREQLRKDAEHSAADEALNKLSNQLLDAVAGGTSLAEAAKELGLKTDSAGPLDKNGLLQDGKKAKLPELDKVLETAFKLSEKSESGLLGGKGGVYYILHVDSVIAERIKPLSEVRTAAIEGWKNAERRTRLAQLAQDTAKGLANAAPASQLRVTMVGPLARHGKDKVLPEALVTDLFSRAVGEKTDAYALPGGDYAFASVKAIISAPLPTREDADMAKLRESISASMSDELTQQYMEYLRRKHHVTVNEAAIKQITQQHDRP